MNEEAFKQKHISKWKKLEEYNALLRRKGVASLNKDEIRDFSELYRCASHDLAYARTHFTDGKTAFYLNQLVSVSHVYFYTREKTSFKEAIGYIKKGFPANIAKSRTYIAAAFLTFLIGFSAAFILVMVDPLYASFFFQPEQIGSGGGGSWDYPMISSFIMANNIRVSLMAVAFGMLAGAGTFYVLFYNGMMIGSLTCYFYQSGHSMLSYWSLILPHGFIELTAIFISGGAGLIIGRSLLMPGGMTRSGSLIKGCREAAGLLPGIIMMLVIAAVIEGFFTPLDISPVIKLGFAFITLVLMVVYFISNYGSLSPDNG